MDFEWNIFPGFNTLQLNEEVKSLLYRLGETPENFTGRMIIMSMFNDITCGSRDNETECLANAKLVFLYARRFGKGQWSFIGPGSEKKWYCVSEDSPQGEWGQYGGKNVVGIRRNRTPSLPSHEPFVHGKLSIHYSADLETIETIFRIIDSLDQLSLYGAVAEMCEECGTLHDRTWQPVVGGQSSSSLVPSVIKTEVPLDCDDLAHKDLLLQQYGERIEKLSQQDKLSKILYGCRISECC